MKKIALFLITSLLMAGITGCKPSTTSKDKKSEKPLVAVSLPPEKFFVENIAGDLVDVVVMVPTSSSPEEYDPTPRNIMDLENADIYFYIGTLPYEHQWIEAVEKAKEPAKLVNLSEALPEEMTHEGHEHEHEGVHPEGDPHYWTSIKSGEIIAEVVYKSLCEAFPDSKATFDKNYDVLKEKISTLSERATQVLGSEREKKAFVIYHPSLSLFSREWNLDQIVIEKDGKQPTPVQIKELIDEAKAKKASVVILQQEYDSKTTESIANELGLKTYTVNPLEENWLSQMNSLIDAFDTPKK